MRQWSLSECAQRIDEIIKATEAIRQRVPECDPVPDVIDDLLNEEIVIWEDDHGTHAAMQQIPREDGLWWCIVGYVGKLDDALAWYASLERQARKQGVAGIEIHGRPGWLGVSKAVGAGFVKRPEGICKRLH